MQPAPLMLSHKTCYKCRYEAETAESRCPRCRKKLWTSGETRGLGAVLVALGGFLMVVMAAIILYFIGLVADTGKPGSGARFSGTKDQLYMVFAILGFVFFFGFVSFAAGMWQVVFARRNMVLIWVVVGLGAIFLVGGTIFRAIVE